MGGLIAGVLVALLLLAGHESGVVNYEGLSALALPIFLFASALAALALLLIGFSWSPLQKTETKLVPRLSELYRKDRRLRRLRLFLLIFPLVTLLFSIYLLSVKTPHPVYTFAVWLILAGAMIDMLRCFSQRITHYFSPFNAIELFSEWSKHSIQEDRLGDLYDSLDSLTETAFKSMQQGIPSLCNASLDECQKSLSQYLQAAKSIGHHDLQPKELQNTDGDTVGYTLFFLLQRLETVENEALEKRSDLVCTHLIRILGKIVVDAAKFDLTLVDYPLHYLGKFALETQKRKIGDAGVKATLTLVEVARNIVNEVDLQYQEIKSCFIGIISYLEELAQESYRQDKQTLIALIKEPFVVLKALFQSEKLKNHQDLEVIQRANDNALGQFQELEVILQTRPSVTDITKQAMDSST